MAIDYLRDKEHYPEAVKEWTIVVAGNQTFAFENRADATALFMALEGAVELDRVWSSGMPGVDYKRPSGESVECRVEKQLALTVTNVDQLGLEGRYYNLRCDHHIFKQPAACGSQKCWRSVYVRPYKGETIPEDWAVFELGAMTEVHDPLNLEKDDESVFHVVCPECIKRIAEDFDVEPDEVMIQHIMEARQIERDALEREK